MPIDILTYLADCGNGIIKGAQTVVGSNYRLVKGLLTVASDTYTILATLTYNLIAACAEIGFYLWEILCEIFSLGDALWNAFERICILIAHVGFVIWTGVETSAGCIASCILSMLKLSYYCVQKTSDYMGISYINAKTVIRTTGKWIYEWLYYALVVTEIYFNWCVKNFMYGLQSIGYAIIDLLQSAREKILEIHDFLSTHIPQDFFFGLLLGMGILSLVLVMIKLLDQKGFTMPAIHTVSVSQPHTDDYILISDDEDDAPAQFTRLHEAAEDSSTNSSTSEDEYSDEEEEEVDEFEVVTDSSSDDASEENNENDQNRINIQLPDRTGRNGRRSRTPGLCGGGGGNQRIVSPDELKKKLETEQEKKLCVVCQDLPKCVLVLPCRHMCMCVECAHEMVNQRNRARRMCPLCRAGIQTVMSVYV